MNEREAQFDNESKRRGYILDCLWRAVQHGKYTEEQLHQFFAMYKNGDLTFSEMFHFLQNP